MIRATGEQRILTDESTPEEIYAVLSINKKHYRKGISTLNKQRKIILQGVKQICATGCG
jgi:predicted RNA-binding protein (virulence factor B family)